MKKKPVIFCAAAAALLFLSGISGTVILFAPQKQNVVQVLRDNEILYTFDLSTAAEQTIRIDYGDSYNIIEIKDEGIKVSEAGCRDNTCVKMGRLSSAAPIVCLPNHLVIRFSERNGGIDAVVG